jgi:hypothetical protein
MAPVSQVGPCVQRPLLHNKNASSRLTPPVTLGEELYLHDAIALAQSFR